MQQVVEDEKRERKAIDNKKMRAIEEAKKIFNDAVKSAEVKSDQELKKAKEDKEMKLAALQRDFKRLPLLHQVYHEAPDVFELIVSKCRQFDEIVWGLGGLNAFRLANRRFKELKDLSPLSSCTALEDLDLINCRLIASLAPLSNLEKLQKLECRAIDLRSRSSPLRRVLGLRS